MNLLVKPLTGLFGIILTIIGIIGFFANGMFLVFETSTMQSVLHVISGLAGLFAFSSSQSASRTYLVIFGLIYAVVTVIGFVMGGEILGLFHTNMADNYLHLGISAVCLIVGFGSGK